MSSGQFRRMVSVSRRLQHPNGGHNIEVSSGSTISPVPRCKPRTLNTAPRCILASECAGTVTTFLGLLC